MTSRAVTITLELRLAGDELDGRATDGSGESRPISGWLGMLVAIDAMLSAAPESVDEAACLVVVPEDLFLRLTCPTGERQLRLGKGNGDAGAADFLDESCPSGPLAH